MPDGVSESQYNAIIERLRSKRDEIALLPTEKQLDVYGVAFDRFAKQKYSKLGLKDKELELVKDRWITGIVAPQMQKPFPEGFGVDKPKHGLATEASAELVGVGAGAMGSIKNVLDFMSGGRKPDFPGTGGQSIGRQLLAKGEESGYNLAHEADPSAAEFGAGVGHMLPAMAAYESAAGAIPKIAKSSPMAWKVLNYLARQTAGTVAMAPTEKDPTVKGTGEQIAAGVLIDSFLHGAGKSLIKTGGAAARVIDKMKTSAKPNVASAGAALDDLTNVILKEKFQGKTLDKLSPTEYDQLFQETKARRASQEAQGRTAAQAVKDAEKAKQPTKEAQILERERVKEAKKAETKSRNEAAKAFHSRLVEYKKRVGSLPEQDSQHMKDLIAGKTADDILGPKPEVAATQAAVAVEDASKTQALQEGAPQALDAVKEVQKLSVGQKIAKSAKKTKKKSMFKTDVSKVLSATSPEEFAGAKREAKATATAQARELAKNLKSSSEGIKIAHELKAEHHRIDTIETPSAFSKKTKDAARKSAEAVGTAGSVDVEKVASSAPNAETEMLRGEQLMDELKDVASAGTFARVNKAIKGKSQKLQNDMVEVAIEALKKTRGPK